MRNMGQQLTLNNGVGDEFILSACCKCASTSLISDQDQFKLNEYREHQK
jgi:hypothetical protein